MNAGRPSHITVNLEILESNARKTEARVAPAKVMAVVKANAYGHGLVEASRAFLKGGAECLAVALIEEAVALRQNAIDRLILVFGGVIEEQLELFFKYDISLTASSVTKVRLISEKARALGVRAKIHLKVDTGMGRLGVKPESFASLLEEYQKNKDCLCLEGVYSHLSDAENEDQSFSLKQLERFREIERTLVTMLGNEEREKIVFHLANSAGALGSSPEFRFDMVRVGLALYGVYGDLLPALSLVSRISYFKAVEKDTPISYGCSWKADQLSRIVTVPVGYGDGYHRSLSNRGQVLIRGKRYPIVGKICMDQLMVSIGQDSAYLGDEVVLIGKQGDEEITVQEVAETIGTVPHDILASLNLRLPREFVHCEKNTGSF